MIQLCFSFVRFEVHKKECRNMLESKVWINPHGDGLKWYFAARTFHEDTPPIFEHMGNCWIYGLHFFSEKHLEKFCNQARRYRLDAREDKMRRLKHSNATLAARKIQRQLITWSQEQGWTDIAFLA